MTWDEYFEGIANAVAQKSHCLSHKFGAIIVRDHVILTTGYNGPPTGYPHCNKGVFEVGDCPRHHIGYKSGQGLELCPAAHAELNVIIAATRTGVVLQGGTMYITSPCPCRECSKAIVNAGIKEVVICGKGEYPDIGLTGRKILEECGIAIRYVEK